MDIKNLKVNFEQKVFQSSKVIIVPHVGIDFDAIGSAIGLSVAIKNLKKVPYILINDLNYKIDHGVQVIIDEVNKDIDIINKDKYLEISDHNDLFILTDVSEKDLIPLDNELNTDNTFIIDHHDSNNMIIESSNSFVDSNISSASEIVARLLNLSKIKYDSNIANYLLAGIYLDTNKLTKNASSDTMRTVAKLLELGADLNVVNDFFSEDFNSDRRIQELVSKAKILTYSIALIVADNDSEYSKEELAKAADYLLKFNVDSSYSIGNIGDNIVSISARSKDKTNVGEIMKLLNGGGNQNSAATKIEDITTEDASKKLLKIIEPPFYTKNKED